MKILENVLKLTEMFVNALKCMEMEEMKGNVAKYIDMYRITYTDIDSLGTPSCEVWSHQVR